MDNKNQNNLRKPGRPTIQEEIALEKKLREQFNHGFEAVHAASVTGIGEKTVRRYFKRFKKELLANFDSTLAERQKIAKARLIPQYDYAIHNFKALLNQLLKAKNEREEAWKRNYNPQSSKYESYMPYLPLEREIAGTQMQLLKIAERKAAIEAAPFVNEEMEKDFLQNTGKRKPKHKGHHD